MMKLIVFMLVSNKILYYINIIYTHWYERVQKTTSLSTWLSNIQKQTA